MTNVTILSNLQITPHLIAVTERGSMYKSQRNEHPQDQMTAGKISNKSNDALIKLATIQPSTKLLDPHPKTLKHFPLRRAAKLFVITDAIMASVLLVARYFVTTRIVTFPIFQLATTTFYLLISCFGIFQIFSVRKTSNLMIFLSILFL